jgi:hypothetical protein
MERERAAGVAFALACLLMFAAWPPGPGGGPPSAAPPPKRGAARLLWGLPLDLNREDERDLEALPGIGPMRARAIRAGRPFCRVADLRRVPGMGPVTLGGLTGHVSVPDPPTVCGD